MENQSPVTGRLEELIATIIRQDMVDVRFEDDDDASWSVVTTFADDDAETSLRLHTGSRYFLYHGYYDNNDDFHEEVVPVTPEQLLLVPPALTKIMTKVLSEEDGMRVPGNLLGR